MRVSQNPAAESFPPNRPHVGFRSGSVNRPVNHLCLPGPAGSTGKSLLILFPTLYNFLNHHRKSDLPLRRRDTVRRLSSVKWPLQEPVAEEEGKPVRSERVAHGACGERGFPPGAGAGAHGRAQPSSAASRVKRCDTWRYSVSGGSPPASSRVPPASPRVSLLRFWGSRLLLRPSPACVSKGPACVSEGLWPASSRRSHLHFRGSDLYLQGSGLRLRGPPPVRARGLRNCESGASQRMCRNMSTTKDCPLRPMSTTDCLRASRLSLPFPCRALFPSSSSSSFSSGRPGWLCAAGWETLQICLRSQPRLLLDS